MIRIFISKVYNLFQINRGELCSTIFSDLKTSIKVNFKDSKQIYKMKEPEKENPVKKAQLSLDNLARRVNNLKVLTRNKMAFINNSEYDSNSSENLNLKSFCYLKCKKCSAKPKFRLSELNQNTNLLTLAHLHDELKMHGHKIRKNFKSNKYQLKKELKSHYLKQHKKM